MQRTQSSGDREATTYGRAARQARRRSAVWLVPNTAQGLSSRLDNQDTQIVGALALDEEAAFTLGAHAMHAPSCILIVEGDSHIANQLHRELNLGANADWANNIATVSHQTLFRPRKSAPAIAIVDAAQLGLDGAAVYRRLQAHPLAQESAIIFITAATALELSARGVEGGMLLRTPLKVAHAITLISALVNER